jgi:hypothetical protein
LHPPTDYSWVVQVARLMIKVEEIFTKQFSDNDRRKAMTLLRPMQQYGNQTTTFFLGESACTLHDVRLAS